MNGFDYMGVRIPPEVQEIFGRLQTRYELEFEPIVIRDRRFRFMTLKNIEPLIAGKDLFAESLEFPFWVKIWESSTVLADFLARMEPVSERRILEIGAGLGVCGVAAAAFGHRAVITDYEEEILDFARVSAAVNGCGGILCQKLDWLHPAAIGKFEMIVGSEVLFHPSFFEPILHVFRTCLAPGGTIYLAHDVRRKSLAGFLPLCEREYDIAVQKRKLSSGDETYDILLTRLVPKDGPRAS